MSPNQNDNKDSSVPNLLLWGHTGAGKSSLLAMALNSNELRPHIKSIDSLDSAGLHDRWKVDDTYAEISQGRNPSGTENPVKITVNFRSGQKLTVTDPVGSFSTNRFTEESEQLLAEASAVLLVLPFVTKERFPYVAIERALNILERIEVKGVAFTKCEQNLKAGSRCWTSPNENGKVWWDRIQTKDVYEPLEWSPRQRALLDLFGQSVWPTSAFGFDDNSCPAMLHDEFGRTIPFQTSRPMNVSEPFQWIIKKLGIKYTA